MTSVNEDRARPGPSTGARRQVRVPTSENLQRQARRKAITPDELMITAYSGKVPTYVEILPYEPGSTDMRSRNYFKLGEGNEYDYACYVSLTMYKLGVRLPSQGEVIFLGNPLLPVSDIVANPSLKVTVHSMRFSPKFRVALIKVRQFF